MTRLIVVIASCVAVAAVGQGLASIIEGAIYPTHFLFWMIVTPLYPAFVTFRKNRRLAREKRHVLSGEAAF